MVTRTEVVSCCSSSIVTLPLGQAQAVSGARVERGCGARRSHSEVLAVNREAGTRWHNKNRGEGPAADGVVPEEDLVEHRVEPTIRCVRRGWSRLRRRTFGFDTEGSRSKETAVDQEADDGSN